MLLFDVTIIEQVTEACKVPGRGIQPKSSNPGAQQLSLLQESLLAMPSTTQ